MNGFPRETRNEVRNFARFRLSWKAPLTRPSATLSPSEGEREGVRGLAPKSEKDQSLVTSAATGIERKARLHALWTLIGSGALDPAFHLKLLENSDPACRAWGVRAAGNFGKVSSAIREKVARLASPTFADSASGF